MNPQPRFQRFLPALVLAFAATTLQAQNVELDIERSVKVEFNSQKGYSYNVYGTSDPAKKTGWKLLGGGDGTGENIVFFYRSETDQKVFFKVESEPSEPGEGPKPQEPVQSIVPITSLPPAESSGTYNLGEAIGENEIGGVYRIGVSAGTDGVVIELPHPGLQEYRQKQIKLSIYRGGTGLGSGKVSLKVPTLAGDEYESRKLVDNASKQLTDEVIILPATGSKDGRKVVVDLFNDTASTDGAAGGQWVVTTAAEAVEPTLAHQWEGTQLTLQNPDGTWGEWVNLQGQKGDKGDRGSSEYEWSGTEIRFKQPDDTWGQWVDIQGPKGGKGDKGEPGSVVAKGIDVSAIEKDVEALKEAQQGFSSTTTFSGLNLAGKTLTDEQCKSINWLGVTIDSKTKIPDKWRVVWEIVNERVSGKKYHNADLSEARLDRVDLSGLDLTGANLSQASLRHADLSNVDLSGAVLTGCIFHETTITNMTIDDNTVLDHEIRQAHEIVNAGNKFLFFRNSLRLISLKGSNLSNLDLNPINGIYISSGRLNPLEFTIPTSSYQRPAVNSSLSNANLSGSNLKNVDMSFQDLRGVIIDNQTYIEKKWMDVWKASNIDIKGENWNGKDLSKAVIQNGRFSKINLMDSNFNLTTIINSNFNKSNLDEANFSTTSMGRNSFRRAKMNNVNFDGAMIANCDFSGADLSGTSIGAALSFDEDMAFSASIADSSFANANLSNVTLGRVLHQKNINNNDIIRIIHYTTNFTRCDFTDANLAGVEGSYSFDHNCIFKNTTMPDGTVKNPDP